MRLWGIVIIILLFFLIPGCTEKEYDYQENLTPEYETVQTTSPPTTTAPPPVVQSGTCFTSYIIIDGVSYHKGTSMYNEFCDQRATSPPTTTRAPTTSYKTSTTTDADLTNGFKRTYTWSYGGRDWGMVLNFYDETYDSYEDRTRQREYDLFASDPYDDKLIKSLADFFTDMGESYGLDKYEIPLLAVSFIQSLPYTSDRVTTGYDEYPRFPYETLYDNGGDCEDTSILTVAILQEMGYGAVLLEIPNHMAVGVKCSSDVPGYYYNYQGDRYCYLETTGENWDVGEMPDEYKNQKVQVIPVYKKPYLDIDFEYTYRYDNYDTYVDVDLTVMNYGSEAAKNAIIYIALQTTDTTKVWDSITSEELTILPEGGYTRKVTNLHVPTGQAFRVYAVVWGDNIVSDEAVSGWTTWS
ncbi:hypothetical protein KKA03_00570 [archaeon]|nr:hypothetical protein [archaeon]